MHTLSCQLETPLEFKVFSKPELKAQMGYWNQSLFVLRLSIVSLSVNFTFCEFSKNAEAEAEAWS